ncbi:MAG: T9SS type A sorting domain-containing protein [Ignavibacteriae bacterium]|nr:T9SS type A sorting domain-containing protein [Ignavibacteriota bacterium]
MVDLGRNDISDQGNNTIRNNDNGNFQVYNNTGYTVNAYNNIWDYQTALEIDAHIYDNEEGSMGEVYFDPWITENPINHPPIANAGDAQTVHAGSIVNLDGSYSLDSDGNYPLTYLWEIVSKPQTSLAILSDPTTVSPTFTVDQPGNYIIELVVADNLGLSSEPAQVQISTINSPPVSDAGPDQAVLIIGSIIQLDGTQSWDDDGDPITYYWNIIEKPAGSNAVLNNQNISTPEFIVDVYGEYKIELIVNDSWTSSNSDQIVISFNNVKPLADAGNNQSYLTTEIVYLDGSSSSDENNDILNYIWSIASKPEGSESLIDAQNIINPTFVPDMVGEYVITLIVNDGELESDPSSITVSVLSRLTVVSETLQEGIQTINQLPLESLKNSNMANTLTNKLNTILLKVDQGNYVDAENQLTNDLLKKTDGCANSGTPDKNDWITDCESQNQIYTLIIQSIDLLNDLINGLAKQIANEAKIVPKTFYLYQNYPNPFNPSTSIKYDLPKSTNVRIVIYNQLGKEIETIINKNQNAGGYTIEYSGINLSSGIYFYRITAGEFRDTKKLIFLK